MGEQQARILAENFHDLDALGAETFEVKKIKGIGPETIKSIRAFFTNAGNTGMLSRFRDDIRLWPAGGPQDQSCPFTAKRFFSPVACLRCRAPRLRPWWNSWVQHAPRQ